jgi:hypothetical protein
MRRFIFAVTAITAIVTVSPSANADLIGAAAGAGTGLVVAGPVGAVAGGVIGGFFGRPFWGPPMGHGACWADSYLHRHCRHHW